MSRPIITRRSLLVGLAGVTAAGCAPSKPDAGFLGAMQRFNGRVQGALNSGSKLAAEPSESERTPLDAFPIYHIGPGLPEVSPGWALEVSGLVDRPLRLELRDLQKLARTEMRVRHHCVEGWSAVADWHGVRLGDLARTAGAKPDARFVEFVSFEPTSAMKSGHDMDSPGGMFATKPFYTSSWDLESALHPQTLIAYGMNGQPLGLDHGGPARLYSANKLGYKMVKWLQAIRFLPHPTGGFWEDQGYEWFAGV